MKKIAHVINTLAGGGSERVAIDIFECVDKNPEIYQKFFIAKNIVKMVVNLEPIIFYNFTKKPFYLPSFIYERDLLKKLQNSLDDFDVVISHLRDMNTRLCLLKKENRFKKKLIIVEHVTKELYSKKELNLVKNLYKYADLAIAVSDKVKNDLEMYGAKNIVVIENCVDIDRVNSLANEKDIKFDKFSIVSVGRLSEDKDFDTLIKAFNLAGIDAKLYILGEGSKKKYLMSLVSELGIEEKVSFLGFHENPFPFVKAADVFVSSSKREAFPLAVLEAMVLGKAVVCTDVIPFAKDGYNSIVVKPGDIESMALALRKLYFDKVLRENLSKNALESAKRYNKDIFCKKYKDIIDLI